MDPSCHSKQHLSLAIREPSGLLFSSIWYGLLVLIQRVHNNGEKPGGRLCCIWLTTLKGRNLQKVDRVSYLLPPPPSVTYVSHILENDKDDINVLLLQWYILCPRQTLFQSSIQVAVCKPWFGRNPVTWYLIGSDMSEKVFGGLS